VGSSPGSPLRVGFLPVNDAAPIIAAHEFGFFEKYDLDVDIQRQISWKTVSEKIVRNELDASHAPATLPFLINLGITGETCPCITALVLSLQGNGITIRRALWDEGVRDGQTLRDRMNNEVKRRTYTFGMPFSFSSPHFLLNRWLRSSGIGPQVRLITVPPSQMFPMLKLGYLDGYCAGEPWNTVAIEAGIGMSITTSASLAPMHPEKVLLVREEFALTRADEHERLIAALLEACRFCASAKNRDKLCQILAQPEYVNAPADCIRIGLERFNVFHGGNANCPTAQKAGWITSELYKLIRWPNRPKEIESVFRPAIHRLAQAQAQTQRTSLECA
jgi:ABC-type nitrate/sulfonate/bicarbonate transport system substrate-binding protein